MAAPMLTALLLVPLGVDFPVFLDGLNALPIPLLQQERGHTAEILHSFSAAALSAAQVEINGTHVRFPLGGDTLIQAGFARSTAAVGGSDAGVANLLTLRTPISLFEGTLGGFAEKVHVMPEEGGPLKDARGFRQSRRHANQTAATMLEAQGLHVERNPLVFDAALPVGINLFRAFLHPEFEATLRARAVEEGAASRFISERDLFEWQALRTRADAFNMGSTLKAEYSMMNCYHFASQPGANRRCGGVRLRAQRSRIARPGCLPPAGDWGLRSTSNSLSLPSPRRHLG
eukprot:scaffold35472_cov31-Tisochrysis_lutea.AAC.12